MMNKTMMEVKTDGSSKFKFLEEKTSKEELLWVIKKGDTVTYLLHEYVKRKKIRQEPLEKSYQHPQVCTCIYIMRIIVMGEIAGGRNIFVEVVDPEGYQCIQRNNTLKVKTPGLIVDIGIPLTYIYKVCYLTSRCCSCDNNP
jgi:hypothetical protein